MSDGEVHEGLLPPLINEGLQAEEGSGENSPPAELSSKPDNQNSKPDEAAIAALEREIEALKRGELPKEGLEVGRQPNIQKPERQDFLKGIVEVIKSILRFFGFPIKPPQPQEVLG